MIDQKGKRDVNNSNSLISNQQPKIKTESLGLSYLTVEGFGQMRRWYIYLAFFDCEPTFTDSKIQLVKSTISAEQPAHY